MTMLDLDSMHSVSDCSQANIQMLVYLLQHSWRTEQWLYREAELDELWRSAEVELESARKLYSPDGSRLEAYVQLCEACISAHNLASEGCLDESARVLEQASRLMERYGIW